MGHQLDFHSVSHIDLPKSESVRSVTISGIGCSWILFSLLKQQLMYSPLASQGGPHDSGIDPDVFCCILGKNISVHLVQNVEEYALHVEGLDLGGDGNM